MQAIETTGHIDKPGILKLDKKITFDKRKELKIIILISDDEEIAESIWMKEIVSNPVFDFLKEEKEDIYSLTDGKPFKK